MTEREKLIELLRNQNCHSPLLCDPNCKYAHLESCYEDRTADWLLSNGVIVPPCKVGDTVWFETYEKNGSVCVGIKPHTVDRIDVSCVVGQNKLVETRLPSYFFGKDIFLSKEEAEKALKERSEGK